VTDGTKKGRPGSCCTGLYQNLQNQLNQGQEPFGVAVEEAIVPSPTEAFGQNMLQDKPQEVFPLESAVKGFAGTAFDVLECDIAISIGNNVVLSDDAPV